ncbi:MAG: hypothetical protein GY811_14650, partial [Myxococcales bacterium]|nr:hypothetical protein [Myxococcales bacterium]
MLTRLLLTAVLGVSLTSQIAACRDDSSDGDAADGGGGSGAADATPGSSITIYDVQSDATSVGSSVTLRSVVVTAIDNFGGRTGGFYVQETAGGPFSGVFVFNASAGGLVVGDLVNIDGGVKDEFSFDFEDGHSITQIVAPDAGTMTVTKVGDGTVPAAEELNPWDLAADDAEAEKWEGVLIKFTGARALGSAFNVSQSDATLLEMSITGPFRMGGSLADLGEAVERDDCFSSITGIGDYFFSYKILPRSGADMVADATGESCLPPEESEALCGDMMDNDHDGFDDCADRSCQDAVAACTTGTTVVEAQNGTIEENSRIRLTDVVVTALAADGRSFFVQDAGGAAAFNGLYVYQRSDAAALPANVDVGFKITLAGRLDEFNTLTELVDVTIEASAGVPEAVTTLDGIAIADLATDKQYEGVLVSVPGAVVAAGSNPACSEQYSSFSLVNGATPLFADEDIFCHTT